MEMRHEPGGHPEPRELAFIESSARFVHVAYARPALAARAGFVRFTDEDRTGAISWANQHWTSTDAEHPSEVWYDAKGRLIGVDYTVLQTDTPDRPRLWEIDPRRWISIRAHMHYGVWRDRRIAYGAMSTDRFEEYGGTISLPDRQILVDAGVAKTKRDVAFLFLLPSIWDLQFWVIPNPYGAFAEYNPRVKPKPQHPQKHSMGM